VYCQLIIQPPFDFCEEFEVVSGVALFLELFFGSSKLTFDLGLSMISVLELLRCVIPFESST